jgi:membrane-associated protease RseP (regulator of RpoE activity)
MVAETHIPSSIKENNLPDKPAATEQINAADFPQPSVDIESASRNKISTKMPNAAAPMTVARSVKKPKPEILSRVNTSEVTGGSRTSASTSTRVITPPGIPINQALRTSPNSVNVKSLTAKDVLLQHGIEAVFENEGWKVKSVMQNSPAARSGIKVGDSIEAIDGEKLTGKPVQNKTIGGKKLSIARGAEKIEISLSNQSN